MNRNQDRIRAYLKREEKNHAKSRSWIPLMIGIHRAEPPSRQESNNFNRLCVFASLREVIETVLRILPTNPSRALRGGSLSAMIVLASSGLQAQTQTASHGTETALIVTGILTAFFVLLTFFIVIVLGGDVEPLMRFFRRVYNAISPKSGGEAIPLEESHDGITELDNRVPPWFNYLFGGTIVFAAVYMLDYHVWGSSPLPKAEYAQELAAADISRRVRIAAEGSVNEDALEPLADDASIRVGHEQFSRNCVTCHGANGGGIVGPNLTDQYWIHGGGIKNIYTIIKNGVPQKGMISWKLVFTPKEIQQIASFILTLQGTNPANGKKPEGTLYKELVLATKESLKAKR